MRLKKIRYKVKHNGNRKNEIVINRFNSKGHIVHMIKSMYHRKRYLKKLGRFNKIYPSTIFTYFYRRLVIPKHTLTTTLRCKLFNRGISESIKTYRVRRSI